MGTYTKNLKLETPSYTDNADIPALAKKNNEIIDSEMIKRANGLDYNEQTGVLQLTGNNSKVGSPIQIKNNLPVTSMASGTELKVNNYKQLIKFTKEGKTEQKSYTGKNIFDYVSNLKASSDGLTSVINDDGSITTAGKLTSNYTTITKVIDLIDLLEDGETYTISQEKYNTNIYIQITARKKDDTHTYYGTANTQKKVSLKIDKTIYSNYYCSIQSNSTSNWGDKSLTITNKYMLCKGTDTADSSFEPYVGGTQSPNPNYPQEIENIKGVENLFYNVITNSTPSGITLTQNDDGSLILNGTTTGVSIFDFKLPKALSAGTYTFSIEGSDNISNYVFLRARDNNGQMVTSDAQVQGNNTTQNSHTFTCEKEIVKVSLNITTTGKTFNNFVIKPMLSKKKSNYVPYGSNYLSFKNVGKNLFNYTPVLITQVKSNLRTNNIYPNSNILLKKGTYILSFPDMVMKNNIKEFGVQLFDNNTQLATLTLSNNKKSAIFTINNDANINRLYTYLDNSDNNDATITYKNIQLEKGTVATDYESYEKKYINIDLQGNELCSNLDKTTNDELIVENGKAKINKKFGEYIFTGNEIFSFADSNTRIKTDSNLLPQLANVYIQKAQSTDNITPLFCTHYAVDSQKNIIKNSNKIGFSQWGNQKFIYFPADYSTIDEFKAKLKSLYDAGTPVIIQYPLSEPEVVDLGEIDFDLIENSTLTCEEESDMQIDYLTISSNIFVQDNLDGSSSQKAPSIDAVNKAINKISNYSSEEQEIGEWFGEKHYRKVFKIDMDSTSKEMTIPTGIDMKQLTHAYGVALYNGTIYLPLNFYNNLGWDSFHLTGKGANIILQRGDNFSITKVFITLEYTKNV